MPSQLKRKAGFEDFPLTLEACSWLHQSRWSDQDYSWYRSVQAQPSLQLFRPPKQLHPKRSDIASSSSSWLLVDNEDLSPLAFLNAHLFDGPNYNRGYIYVKTETGKSLDLSDLAAIFRLIFLVGRADQVYFLAEASLLELFGGFVGESKTLFSMPVNPWMASQADFVKVPALLITRQEWLNSREISSLSKQHTSHIESRLARQEAAEKLLRKKRRKRGLIFRIFRPRIDD